MMCFNLNSVIKPYLVLERTLQMNKNPTAEELHKLIMRKKITYEQIRRIDQNRFSDLEATMRMLYDHGNINSTEAANFENQITHTNASLKEPQRPSGRKAAVESGSSKVGQKRGTNTRPESSLAKQN